MRFDIGDPKILGIHKIHLWCFCPPPLLKEAKIRVIEVVAVV
jgi:hypothetical protein